MRIGVIIIGFIAACTGTVTGQVQTEALRTLARAMVANEKNEIAEAEKLYRRALELDPNLAEAHQHLGVILLARRERDEAARHLAEALRMRPNSAMMRVQIATSMAKLGYVADAERIARDAVKVDPAFAPGYQTLATVLYSLGRTNDSASVLKSLVTKVDRDDPVWRYRYAMILADLKDTAAAEEQMREVLRLKADYAPAHFQLAVLLLARGAANDAENSYKKAIFWDDKFAEAYANLGGLYAKQRRTDDAIAMFEKARALYTARSDTNMATRVEGFMKQIRPDVLGF